MLPFSKYPELDELANLLPAHIECDSCKGASHLQSIVNEADFDLLTINVASLHPRVAKDIKQAKELYKQKAPQLPNLLNTEQFPRLTGEPAPQNKNIKSRQYAAVAAQPEKNNSNNNSPSTEKPKPTHNNKFIIHYSDLKMSDEKVCDISTLLSVSLVKDHLVWYGKQDTKELLSLSKYCTTCQINTSKNLRRKYPFSGRHLIIKIHVPSDLRHPNVILMIGTCVPPDPCAIVTELYEKRSLQHVLDSKDPLTESMFYE